MGDLEDGAILKNQKGLLLEYCKRKLWDVVVLLLLMMIV
jgi:hypothetical protein